MDLDDNAKAQLEHWRREFDNAETPEKRSGAARMLLVAGIHAMWDMVGLDALKEAYGADPADDAPREEHLRALWSRLSQVDDIFGGIDRTAKSSISAAIDEIRAISAGDKPRIFAPLRGTQGRHINAWRRAHHQLRALVWIKYLKRSNPAAVSQSLVAVHFVEHPPTILSWRSVVERELGDSYVEFAMKETMGHFPYIGFFFDAEQAEQALKRDGERWQREKRSPLEIV